MEGCLDRIGEYVPDGEMFLRDMWEEGSDREFVVEALKTGVEVREGRPSR